MHADRRIYSTVDGRLVEHGDPGARFLRYAVGDEIAKADEAALKERERPADKARARPSTKDARPAR